MEILHNKTILIGREPEKSRLMIAINTGNGIKATTIGEAGSVPNSVSRCIAVNNMAHCRLEVDKTGGMRLTNMKEENVTYVNGNEIMSKAVTADSTIELGGGRFAVKASDILDKAKAMLTQKEPAPVAGGNNATANEYTINHLEDVWNEYNGKIQKIQKEQKRDNIIKSLYLPISIIGSGLGIFIKSAALWILPITATILIYGLYKTITDKSAAKKEKLNDWLIDHYTCPNPDCKRFMGFQPFKIVKQNKACPYCKSRYKA